MQRSISVKEFETKKNGNILDIIIVIFMKGHFKFRLQSHKLQF